MAAILDASLTIAENAVIQIGRDIDRLRVMPVDTLAGMALRCDNGEMLRGEEALDHMALHLMAIADIVRERKADEFMRDVMTNGRVRP